MYENRALVYRAFPSITVIARRKVELAKIARKEKLARARGLLQRSPLLHEAN